MFFSKKEKNVKVSPISKVNICYQNMPISHLKSKGKLDNIDVFSKKEKNVNVSPIPKVNICYLKSAVNELHKFTLCHSSCISGIDDWKRETGARSNKAIHDVRPGFSRGTFRQEGQTGDRPPGSTGGRGRGSGGCG